MDREETELTYTGPEIADYHDTTKVIATLTDPDDCTPVKDKLVTFRLGTGDSCSDTTNANGIATCSLTPTEKPGAKNIVASFAGDQYYKSSIDNKQFVIAKEETTLTFNGSTVILAGSSIATLSGKLVEDGSNDTDSDGGSPGPAPAQSVTLSIGTGAGAQSCTGTTSSTGEVSCMIPSVTVPLGPETIKASFAGDDYYLPSSTSVDAIVFAFPSNGVFVLGDQTVAAATPLTTLSWWSNNWYLLNVLSAGQTPAAFKGFAATVKLPTNTPANLCSDNWTSGGGNSPPPPASVPSYMGVIVATSVTKAPGGKIGGNYVRVVVVRTDPGYAPGPANAGTGTIVATFCH
jgi:hypothetical protein